MCGIFAYLLSLKDVSMMSDEDYQKWYEECHKRSEKIKPRGPERYHYAQPKKSLFLGFQRLAIVDPTPKGDQPFQDKKKRAVLICNGEIYNSVQLVRKYKFKTQSHSDCEVILHMYLKFGLERTLAELDGVFAFIIYDYVRKELIAARDPYGVRPLFIYQHEGTVALCSEVKGLFDLEDVVMFPGGTFWRTGRPCFEPYMNRSMESKVQKYANGASFTSFAHRYIDLPIEDVQRKVRQKLTLAVKKRLQADRRIGCLLSGGLDSSLVAALVHKLSDLPIITYSIGLEGATDLIAARKVAAFLGTEHHEVTFTEEEGLAALKDVIYALETWDVTTIRASTPMYLLAKYIKRVTPKVKVIFSGEGADEVCQGYLYFHDAPTPAEGHKESVRILRDLPYFDVLRADRSLAAHGLEARVPFLDKHFIDFYLSIPQKWRTPTPKFPEKHMLRASFTDEKLLPPEILWRKKEAFSDGCSSKDRSWHHIIQEQADKAVTRGDLKQAEELYPHCPPKTKEACYFRQIFDRYFPESGRAELIPYLWMPKWQPEGLLDPSARELKVYS
jgi:asparagine synthase (glutamine-hydrolysing)